VWAGFGDTPAEPSPKSQAQEAGLPVDVSVNCTVRPATGDVGLKVNEAVIPASPIVTVRLMLSSPFAPITVKVTVLVSGVS
jgi:hypothetical protein